MEISPEIVIYYAQSVQNHAQLLPLSGNVCSTCDSKSGRRALIDATLTFHLPLARSRKARNKTSLRFSI